MCKFLFVSFHVWKFMYNLFLMVFVCMYVCLCVLKGPTVLEVFNTLLKHLRMSVDFELGDSSRRNSGTSVSSSRGKENEERIVQNAIIQTIG